MLARRSSGDKMEVETISNYQFWTAVLATSFLKLLMLPSYRSTDFEVHRNWLAITHSLPLEQWYYEKTSEWTLDYPPFFAYFEWLLGHVAKCFDPGMLKISNLNYASSETILFQKLSVIVADLILAYSVLRISSSPLKSPPKLGRQRTPEASVSTLLVLVFLNAGLFIVDHIHFQYNGFLFGVLLLSISSGINGNHYQSAAIFAVLLNLKHIFLYMAPAFGVYYLRNKVFPKNTTIRPVRVLKSVFTFAAIGVSIFALSFGPFYRHIPQILKRLFPFQRGLSHAYWAPNVWAAYNTVDWLLNIILHKTSSSSVTSGLVGTASLSVLPQVAPICTLLLTLAFMSPALITLWKTPTPTSFVHSLVLTAWTSFMFGYHVHEKAILNVILPFSLLSYQHPSLFFVTLTAGTVSLFPLLFTPHEIIIKAVLTILHLSLSLSVLPINIPSVARLYLLGFPFLYLFENLGPFFLPSYPFLPLIAVSDYCLLGLLSCYFLFYQTYLTSYNSRPRTLTAVTSAHTYTSVTTITSNGMTKSPPSPSRTPRTSASKRQSSSAVPQSPSRAARKSLIEPSDRVLRKRTQ